MRRYKERVPDVQAIIDAMVAEGIVPSGDAIENDHRLSHHGCRASGRGLAGEDLPALRLSASRPFHFPGKKLAAWWYPPPQPVYPRIFISQLLLVDDLSIEAAEHHPFLHR